MNNERQLWKGQLAEAEEEFEARELESKGLIQHLRNHLNPFEPDLTNLKVGQIENSSKRLVKLINEMKQLKKRITELQEALGIG